MKRIVAFLLLLMMLVSCAALAEGVVVIGAQSNARDDHDRAERVSGPHTSGYWTYYLLDDGTVEISAHDYNNHAPETLTIPATLDNYQVSSIACQGADGYSSQVTIPDSITNIIENPFGWTIYCKKIIVTPEHTTLATIDGVLFNKEHKRLLCYPASKANLSYTIPKGIRELANRSFSHDQDICTITIPDTVTRIDGNPFANCVKLTTIDLSASHPNLVMNGDVLIDEDTGTIHTFLHSSTAKKYAVPSSITTIADYAFYSCIELTTIEFPSTLTTIGDAAFYKVPLDTVILPDGLTSIGAEAFYEGAKNVTIPASVEFIGENAFRKDVILTVDHDSYALEYARKNNLEYTYPDSLDWLLY